MAPALRPARHEDAAGIRALFQEVHGRPLGPELFAWRYDGRPGAPSVSTVAEEGGRVVAHLGTLRVLMDGPAAPLHAGLWADLMVAPDRRDLGLFMDMAEANMRDCAQAGLALLYAFPNDRSFPLLKRLFGWDDLGDLSAWEGPVAPSRPGQALDGLPPAAALDSFWASARPPGTLALRRDAAWAAWRYTSRPGGAYRAFHVPGGGWAAAKVFTGPDGTLGDILDLVAGPHTEPRLVEAAMAWFRSQGASRASAWAAPGDPRASLWAQSGLAPCGPRTHFAVKVLDEGAAAFARDPLIWRISKGDSDVF